MATNLSKFPDFIHVTKIYGEGIDEWYHVIIEFDWPVEFNVVEFMKQASPQQMTLLRQRIVRFAVESKEFVKFYSYKPSVLCQVHSCTDETRRVTLPRWTRPSDYDNWEFNDFGGWISASDR